MTRSPVPGFIFIVVALACSDTTGPALTMAEVSGTYVPSRLVSITSGSSIDELAAGAQIVITLSPAGDTGGRIFVPGSGDEQGDFEADLTGTWSLDGLTVNLDHPADTFLRDMDLVYDLDRLSGATTFGDTRVEITLVRQ